MRRGVSSRRVLGGAQENLSAIRGLAEIHHRQGDVKAALTQYQRALSLAPNDPDLEDTVADLTQQLESSVRSRTGSHSRLPSGRRT